MNGPQLKAWRQSEDLSLREVSEILNGDPTVSTLSRWENSTEEIPSLVSERLLNSTLITLPLGELHQLLDYCRATQQPFHTGLAQALREHLSRTQSATIPAHATTTEAAPAIHEPAPPTDSQATQAGQAWIEAKNLQSEIPPGYAIGKLTVTPDEAAQSGSSPSSLFGFFDLSKAVMTKEQEQHIQKTGCCPRPECQPHEGRATPMKWLGSVGRAHSLHCSRCDSVWLVPPPMDEPNALRELPPPSSSASTKDSIGG